jgi:hypothetical protein
MVRVVEVLLVEVAGRGSTDTGRRALAALRVRGLRADTARGSMTLPR